MRQEVYPTAGSFTFTVPAGITSVDVEVWGGGGGGTNGVGGVGSGGGGGGGGAYSKTAGITVAPAEEIPLVVGAAGTANGGNGGDSSFDTTVVVAKGGTGATAASSEVGGVGGAGGSSASGTGDTKWSGGSGGNGESSGNDGGGGGAAAIPTADGQNGGVASIIAGGGSNGGWGGGAGTAGKLGTGAGGGGGGGGRSGGTGAAGAAGKIVISYASLPGDVLASCGSSVNLTVTNLHSLATSATWVGGWESDAIDNTTDRYQNYRATAKITVASSGLSAGEIRMYLVEELSDGVWPDVFDGAESVETVTDVEMRDAVCLQAAATATDTGASKVYYLECPSVRRVFRGRMPSKFSVFLAHSTGANLAPSGNQITVTGSRQALQVA